MTETTPARAPVPPEGPTVDDIEAAIVENRGWFIAFGILLIIIGAVAVAAPLLMTVAVKLFIGWVCLIAGFVQVFHAFSAKGVGGVILNILIGVLYIIVGGWLAFLPLSGIFTLTILLAAMFIVEGAFKIGLGMQYSPAKGYGWVIFSGVISLILGGMIFADLPGSAAWAIGLIVGINFIMSGIAFLQLAMAGRSMRRKPA